MEADKSNEKIKLSNTSCSSPTTDAKLEWMYKDTNRLINREEYLLGRSVDKSFELLQEEEQRREQEILLGVKQPVNHVEHECVPFSIRFYKNYQTAEQVDLQRKILEDPLMIIKQREMESRRRILDNPVRLKELRKAVKASNRWNTEKNTKKSKKSKKSKSKKKKKRGSSSSSSSEDDPDIDNKLMEKLRKQFPNDDINFSSLMNADYGTISKYLDNTLAQLEVQEKKKNKMREDHNFDEISQGRRTSEKYKTSDNKKKEQVECSKNSSITLSNISSEKEDNQRKYDYRNGDKDVSRTSRSRYSATYCSSEKRSISRSPVRKQKYRRSRSRSREDNRKQNSSKLSKESNDNLKRNEKEAKLREMMLNAEWREEERSSKVKKHRDERAKEEAKQKEETFDKQFLNKEIRKAIDSQTSIKSRLHANINNIQRNSLAMTTNFARK